MKSLLIAFLLATTFLFARPVVAQDVAITNARIIVGSGQVIDSGTIIVPAARSFRSRRERRRRKVCARSMLRA